LAESLEGSPARHKKPRIGDLTARLEEAEATMRAINSGEVDAVVVSGPNGPQVYTLEGADHPYRVLVEQMHEGTLTLDADGVILYSNNYFAAMVNAPVDSITGSRFTQLLSPPEFGPFTELQESTARRGHASGEFELLDSRGGTVPVRLSLTRFAIAGMQATCVVASDLREQRRNEAILQEQQLSRLIFSQAGEAIVVIDPQGVIIRVSESAKQLAGRPIVSVHFDEAFHLTASDSPLDAARIFSDTRAGHRIRGLEAEMQRSNGGPSSLLVNTSPLWSQANEFLGCVITLTDITQRKRAEDALVRQAEELTRANTDLRQFAHSASHDLREPLRQLAVFSELLQKKYQDKLDAEAVHLIQHTVDSAHRMENLLRGLLDYTQAAGAPLNLPAPSNANEVLLRTLQTLDYLIAESHARIERQHLPLLAVHEVHLTQLFQNLIGNALKYRSEAPPVIHISVERDGSCWAISIADNGIGIAKPYQEQIFGLFQRLHGGGRYSGSGIGLAICEKIVQRYGGRIWVESELGRGSKFVFTLPGADS
jgi:PAS domain S-box-containing protein